MNDIEKLKVLTDDIDNLLKKGVTASSEVFVTWQTKTRRLLGKIFGEDSNELKSFSRIHFSPIGYAGSDADMAASDRIACQSGLQRSRGTLRAYIEELEETTIDGEATELPLDFKKVFIVHGHDGELKQIVARLLEKQGIEAVILSEQPNQGMTIIEKIEAYSEGVDAAICLFTPDDEMKDGSKRARENVVLETGYFIGKIGREKTIVIAADGVMNLSDLKGIVYVSDKNWELDVLKELREIGYSVDFNKL